MDLSTSPAVISKDPNAHIACAIASRVIKNLPHQLQALADKELLLELEHVIRDQAFGMLLARDRGATNKALMAILVIEFEKMFRESKGKSDWRWPQRPKDIHAAIRSGTMPKPPE